MAGVIYSIKSSSHSSKVNGIVIVFDEEGTYADNTRAGHAKVSTELAIETKTENLITSQ